VADLDSASRHPLSSAFFVAITRPSDPMRAPLARTMHELLAEQAIAEPDRTAVIAGDRTYSYAQMRRRAGALAGALHEGGVRRGDRVASLIHNRVEFLDVLFACGAVGAVMVPLSTWSTRSELAFLLEDARPRVLFTLATLGERDVLGDVCSLLDTAAADTVKDLIVVGGASDAPGSPFDTLLQASPLAPLPPGESASAADTFVILYTSGSSNRPKAVPLLHHATIENGFNIGERQGYTAADRVFLSVPLFWSYAAVNALPAAFSHGAAVVLQERFEASEALDLIESHACTAVYTLPAITNALLAAPEFAPARTRSLRTGLTIGSPQDVVRAAEELGAAEICNIYGSTETYGNCCVTPHDWPLARRAGCQGPPLPGVRLRIRDADSGAPCAPGEVGQVEVTGYLTPGYGGDSARFNAEVFDAEGWFHTGDLAAVDEQGHIAYAGRSHEMIKRSGINVSPAEVEEVLQQHPGVGLAGVTGATDEALGERIVAFVVRRPRSEVDADALLRHCREHLSSYKLPDRIAFRDALPLTPTGKLLRRSLKTLAARGDD
jgi:fatty-acyl-CoA synthase